MELLLLLLAVPILWMLMLPARVVGRVRRRAPIGSMGLVALVILGGVVLIATHNHEPPRADYGAGDAALRAMLE